MPISPAGTDCRARRRRYTFVEMLVVCVIVVLATALVLPRVTIGSKRMVVENALSELRGVFVETGMRARAGGKPLSLVLLPNEMRFTVSERLNELDRDWHPPVLEPLNDGAAAILPGAEEYPVPADVEWTELPEIPFGEDGIVYRFFPDGEASGPVVAFDIKGRHFRLVVDSVLGKATVLEEE